MPNPPRNAGRLIPLFLFLAAFSARGADFPVIERLDSRDPVFKQYVEAVDLSRRLIYGKKADPHDLVKSLRIYSYSLLENDDILGLAARCNIPYAGIATLNRISHPESMPETVLFPSIPGIFVPETPSNDLEQLMASSRDPAGGVIITIERDGEAERYLFLPGGDFSPTERTYFFNTGFHFPLRQYRVTSVFGPRPSPFTGRMQNHQGLDLAAPAGASVYAAREGRVTETGTDPVYGNYIIVAHDDNWVSLYGHLSAVTAAAGGRVSRNSVIGRVGSTGQSTGPHLHFEIRKNGRALDPGKLLFKN
ncbi:MAG: M23 family metallopeptidase [Treponema sp.]|jgi:murein DD-endopeptidase MepM/ murein hydrolase activator NlpD|nr:M23 family metallopeptidase [Treponema sp.]